MTEPIKIYRHQNSKLYGVRWDGRDTRVDLDGADPIKLAQRVASAIRGALDVKEAVVEFVVADTGRRLRVTVFAPAVMEMLGEPIEPAFFKHKPGCPKAVGDAENPCACGTGE